MVTQEDNKKRQTIKPFVKWAGGKRQLLRKMKQIWPSQFHKYIEPFVGGGICYFTLRPQKAVLSDINEELINCYDVIKSQVNELMELLDEYAPLVSDKEYYYSIRGLDVKYLTKVERAARFIFLNKTCYNGLYRVNRNGQFNVPFGRHGKPPTLYNKDNLEAATELLQGAVLSVCDFANTSGLSRQGDFIYLDPPYHRSLNSGFISYSSNGFHEEDQVRLAEEFIRLDKKGCKVLLSNSDTDLVRELYEDYRIIPVMTYRSINSVASKRSNFAEVLVLNYDS